MVVVEILLLPLLTEGVVTRQSLVVTTESEDEVGIEVVADVVDSLWVKQF